MMRMLMISVVVVVRKSMWEKLRFDKCQLKIFVTKKFVDLSFVSFIHFYFNTFLNDKKNKSKQQGYKWTTINFTYCQNQKPIDI